MSIRKVIKFNNINKKIFRGGAVMKKNNILKFDNFFSKIAFIYIILIPFFFQERNRIIFICFGLLFFVEKLFYVWYMKDDFSKGKKIIYLLVAILYIICSIYGIIQLFGLI